METHTWGEEGGISIVFSSRCWTTMRRRGKRLEGRIFCCPVGRVLFIHGVFPLVSSHQRRKREEGIDSLFSFIYLLFTSSKEVKQPPRQTREMRRRKAWDKLNWKIPDRPSVMKWETLRNTFYIPEKGLNYVHWTCGWRNQITTRGKKKLSEEEEECVCVWPGAPSSDVFMTGYRLFVGG